MLSVFSSLIFACCCILFWPCSTRPHPDTLAHQVLDWKGLKVASRWNGPDSRAAAACLMDCFFR